ncbi:hypothetical protein HELRODRAFT_157480 [Helobdella robusta]|uniref:Protein SEC13 homolog n=1 Tax=Helobdella robusta TaxID=6412 RepID=T1EMC0_HELRO|nr:hypothetical protein HELRODRAFT_157480 [Helobdella robusta]ESN98225.1 hypothetical protein HELRODRAFT_157480 [Helobdella robusta]
MIHDAQMDYYGVRLATCSTDRSVRIFDVRNNQQLLVATLKEHEGPVWQLAWAHPMYGSLLASCGYDKKVIIWKETNGVWGKVYAYDGFDSSVNSVCWAPYEHGLILAAGSSDRSISILSYTNEGTWESKKIINAHAVSCNAVSWAPAIKSDSIHDTATSMLPPKRFVSGGADYLVKIWREDNGQWVEDQKLEMHSDWVRDVAWAPSIGIQKNIIASCSQDTCVYIWTNDGTSSTWTPKLLHKFGDVVWHLSWSVTGNILAVSGGDNKVSLWKENLEGDWTCISNVVKGQGETAFK